MKFKFLLLILVNVLALMSVLVTGARVMAAPIAVKGVALNATLMKPASGIKLELIRPAASGDGSLLGETTVDKDGRFAFPAREMAADDLLIVRGAYQGYGYLATAFDGQARLKEFGVTVNPQQVQLTVYEASKKPPKLQFQVHHLAIESAADGLKCIERIVVNNPSKSTYVGVGDVDGTVLLDIPKTAKNIKMDPKIPGKLVQTSHGWMATTPIAPSAYTDKNPLAGPNAIIFSYTMEWPSALPWARQVDVSQKILYPTKFFFIARKTDDRVLQVSAPQLSPDTEQELPIDGQSEVRLVNSIGRPMGDEAALSPDTQLKMTIKREVNALFWVFVAFIGALLLGVPLVLRASKRRPSQLAEGDEDGYPDDEFDDEESWSDDAEPAHAASVVSAAATNESSAKRAQGQGNASSFSPLQTSLQAQALIEEIAQLDDEFERGEIDETTYQTQRKQRKSRLLQQLSKP